MTSYVPGTKLLVLGMVIPPSIKIPCNGFIPYHRKTQAAHPGCHFWVFQISCLEAWDVLLKSSQAPANQKNVKFACRKRYGKNFFLSFLLNNGGFKAFPNSRYVIHAVVNTFSTDFRFSWSTGPSEMLNLCL